MNLSEVPEGNLNFSLLNFTELVLIFRVDKLTQAAVRRSNTWTHLPEPSSATTGALVCFAVWD